MKNNRKRARGALIAELPAVLWMLFLFMAFPLIDLATITLNTTFLMGAARDAAHSAAKAKTFKTAISASEPSAQQIAVTQANRNAASFGGISISSVTTNIVITNVNTQATTRQTTPLAQPADTNANTYEIEVVVTGQVKPLVSYNLGFFGNIPGLTKPMTLSPRAQEFCEYPDGLNK